MKTQVAITNQYELESVSLLLVRLFGILVSNVIMATGIFDLIPFGNAKFISFEVLQYAFENIFQTILISIKLD